MATIRKRVGPKGTHYMAVVRCEGQSCTATFRTKSEAKKWAEITEAEITKGKHLPNPDAKRKTVRDLLERYKRSSDIGPEQLMHSAIFESDHVLELLRDSLWLKEEMDEGSLTGPKVDRFGLDIFNFG